MCKGKGEERPVQKAKEITISEAEWEIMRVVWANIQVNSREVIDVLKNKMDWKESTIKTLMRRLVDKDILKTKRNGRSFIYSATVSEEETIYSYSEEIFDRICDKKNVFVLQDLIKDAQLSQTDIEELITQLQEKKETAPVIVPCTCEPGQCDCKLIKDM